MDDILRLEGVSKSFGGVEAVHDFSLAVREGEITGLIGPNGAGKTTLFDLISGLARVDCGRVVFDGADVTLMKPHRRASLGISRTFQLARPLPRMSVAENVLVSRIFGSGTRGRMGDVSADAYGLLERVSLLGKADSPAGSLTLAEQRRLELARALGTMPRLLLLDEAMAGLTPVERLSMIELVRGVAKEKGLTVIMSEHVMEAVAGLCGRLVVMYQGRNFLDGEAGTVLRSDKVAGVYLGMAEARERRAGPITELPRAGE